MIAREREWVAMAHRGSVMVGRIVVAGDAARATW